MHCTRHHCSSPVAIPPPHARGKQRRQAGRTTTTHTITKETHYKNEINRTASGKLDTALCSSVRTFQRGQRSHRPHAVTSAHCAIVLRLILPYSVSPPFPAPLVTSPVALCSSVRETLPSVVCSCCVVSPPPARCCSWFVCASLWLRARSAGRHDEASTHAPLFPLRGSGSGHTRRTIDSVELQLLVAIQQLCVELIVCLHCSFACVCPQGTVSAHTAQSTLPHATH